MALDAPSYRPEAVWHPGAPEALRLAGSLRDHPLTVLCGARGTSKSALLIDGVLPLLRRRGADTLLRSPGSRGVTPLVVPAPARERRGAAGTCLAETVVYMGLWNRSTDAALHHRIDAALRVAGVEPEWHRARLPERVEGLSSRFGLRFLFVFDAFDRYLRSPQGPDRIDDELIELLGMPQQVHTLIALRPNTVSRLERLLGRLPDGSGRVGVLTLEGGRLLPAAQAPPRLRSVPAVAGLPTSAFGSLTTAATPKGVFMPRPPAAEMKPSSTGAPSVGVPNASPPPPTVAARTEPAPARRWRWRLEFAPIAALLLIGAALLLRLRAPPDVLSGVTVGAQPQTTALPQPEPQPQPQPQSQSQSPPATTTTSTPLPRAPTAPTANPAADVTKATNDATRLPGAAAAALPATVLTLLVEGDGPAASRLPDELSRAFDAVGAVGAGGVGGGAGLQVRRGASVALGAALGAAPAALAVARYDALQAAAGDASAPPLAVLTPLYTEELVFVVRADSPLEFIHQIADQPIDAGPVGSARWLTGQTVYRRMFGALMPAAAPPRAGAQAALRGLIDGSAAGVVLLVAPQPVAALDALPPEARRAVKVLRLDPAHPSSRNALQAYLPATLAAGAAPADRAQAGAAADLGTPTLASMVFLVARAPVDAPQTDALARVAATLCASLPALQRSGDPKWRSVRLGVPLPVPLPYALAGPAAWRGCAPGRDGPPRGAATGALPAAMPIASPSTIPSATRATRAASSPSPTTRPERSSR